MFVHKIVTLHVRIQQPSLGRCGNWATGEKREGAATGNQGNTGKHLPA